jgi:predicted AAA+ superfamily ATPase
MLRPLFYKQIEDAFAVNPVVAILGPRQVGKTTLARDYINKNNAFLPQNYFDLERIIDLERLQTPELALSQLKGLITIDEIQRIPGLFETLRVLCDRPNNEAKFLILGSASTELIRQSSESLAGRISYIELTPFNYTETQNLDRLWVRGGFPRSFLAESDVISDRWRSDYIRTFLEQDIPNLGIKIAPANLRRFWMMLAHYHGNIFNASEIGNSLGLTSKTVQHYLDILCGTFMARQLSPWFENISKRQVKSPKIYFRDSGILHSLLGIDSKGSLLTNPKLGASWEGLALEEIIRYIDALPNECFFWASYGQAELDLLVIKENKKHGFEFKYTDRPRLTLSMRTAMRDLKLTSLTVIYPGDINIQLDDNIQAVGLTNFLSSSSR